MTKEERIEIRKNVRFWPEVENLQDPLKPLSEILEPDERQAMFVSELDDNHRAISEISLHSGVPLDIRQLFETAKNVSLYSWFVYRFHQVAEMVGYSAMEMALKTRYKQENPDKNPPMLQKLLKHAKGTEWISDDRFSDQFDRAFKYAGQRKCHEAIAEMTSTGVQSIEVDEPTDDEIKQAIKDIDIVGSIVENAADLRNDLAHGSSTLHPNSISTLRTISEVINQVFEPVSVD